MLIFLASVCVEPKGTHLPDRKALGKIKCAVSVRLLAAVNKKMLFLARLYFRNNKTPYSYSHKRIQWNSRWKICYYQRCLKLYCRHVNVSATKLMILRGMAVINERAVLYTGCPRQADHGIAIFSVASSKPSLPIVLVATIMYYVTTIKYLRLTHGDCRYYDFWQCVSPYTLNCCMSTGNW